jgi:anaerobic ribonucleoside-triphosphate reductase
MWTHWGLNWFFFPNPIFTICLNFQQQNPLKTQYSPHLSSQNCEINSIKSNSLSVFQQHQEHIQIPIQFSTSILFNFHWENDSIINIFHAIASNSLKPSQCTPTHQELFEHTKSTIWSTMVWRSWHDKKRQNNLPCFIDRCDINDKFFL